MKFTGLGSETATNYTETFITLNYNKWVRIQLTTAIKPQKLDFISKKVETLTILKAKSEAYSC